MRKNTKTLFAVMILTTVLVVQACRKFDFLKPDKSFETLSVEDAKDWYYGVLLKKAKIEPEELLSAQNNADAFYLYATNQGKHPVWNLGEQFEISNYDVVTFPLRYEAKNIQVPESLSETDKQRYISCVKNEIVIYRYNNGTIKSRLVTFLPDASYAIQKNFDISINTIADINDDYTGMIVVRENGEKIIKIWRLENGKIKAKLRPFFTNNSEMARAENTSSGMQCSYQTVDNYRVVCVGYMNGDVYVEDYCTEPEFTGTELSFSCEEIGGDDNLSCDDVSTPENECFGGLLGDPPGDGGGGHTPPSGPTDAQLRTQFDEHINDSLLVECLKTILTDIKGIQSGKIAEIIQKFSGNIPNWNWTFTTGTLPNNQNANTNWTGNGIETILDYNKLKNGTNISIARTIIHESIHAYLVAYFRTDPTKAGLDYPNLLKEWRKAKNPNANDLHHSEMERSFVKEIADALEAYGNSIGLQIDRYVYDDLAWGGLDFDNNYYLSPDDKVRIQNRLSAEKTNQKFGDEDPKGQKNCN